MDADLQTTAAIRSRNDALRDALTRQDFAGVGLIYLDGAVLYPQDADDFVGRARIVAYWRKFRGIGVTFESSALTQLSEGSIQEVGRLRIAPHANGANRANTRYLSIWRKSGSEWQIETSIFNRTALAQPDVQGVAGSGAPPIPHAAYVPRVK